MINEGFENEDTINEDIASNQSESLEIIQSYKNELSKCEEENKELKGKLCQKNEDCQGFIKRIETLESLNSKLIVQQQNQKSQYDNLVRDFLQLQEKYQRSEEELLEICRRQEEDLEEKLNKARETIQLLSIEKELDKLEMNAFFFKYTNFPRNNEDFLRQKTLFFFSQFFIYQKSVKENLLDELFAACH
jgi:chromosome segregation ATPase